MRGLILEEGSFGANPGAKDLARHMYTRVRCGKIVIIAERPQILLALLRKQWLKLARVVNKERSSTLNGKRIQELTQVIAMMQSLRFTSSWSPEDYMADVYVITLEEALLWAPQCRTLYITQNTEAEKIHIISSLMNAGGLVVISTRK